MRDGWESQARNWARFARTPGHDSPHEEINLPALLRLLPPPNGLALEAYGQALEEAGLLIEAIREPRAPEDYVARQPSRRRWQRIPMSLHLRAIKP
jgi:hypothetical protein